MENISYSVHVSILRAVLTSLTWRFGTEAGILQVAQWPSPVASLQLVY
jgi:hypothetical protein